jgi:muramoyltetrapeptide carboxypeptidase
MGFSDATAILLFLVHQAGMVAFHGPTLSKHAEEGFACTLAALNPGGFSREVWLRGPKYKVVIPGKAQGRVTGGCLSLVVSLLGTPFMPNLEGWMLFLEDIGEPSHRLYRMLVQLRLAGVFEKVSAVIFGPLGVSLDEPLVLQALKDLKIPVVMGIPSGHMPNMLPLPLGIRASLDTQEGVLRYLETPFLD